MGRNKRPSRYGHGFVQIFWTMLNSGAYKKLPNAAAKALPYFLGKVRLKQDDPNKYLEEFPFSYSEGKRYGFAFSTFSKIIQNLVHYGFIDPVDKGGLRGCGRSYSFFKLSMRWQNYGTEQFKKIDWKCFQPRDQRQLQKVKRTTSKNEMSDHV